MPTAPSEQDDERRPSAHGSRLLSPELYDRAVELLGNVDAHRSGLFHYTLRSIAKELLRKPHKTNDSIYNGVVATAMDFTKDGNMSIHYCFTRPRKGNTPVFDCAPAHDTARFIYRMTNNVFRTNGPAGPKPKFRNVDCPQCKPKRNSSPNPFSRQATRRSSLSLASPKATAVPKTRMSDNYAPSPSRVGNIAPWETDDHVRESTDTDSQSATSSSASYSDDSEESDASSASGAHFFNWRRSETSPVTWRTYRGGHTVDCEDLARLWRPGLVRGDLVVGTNVLLDDPGWDDEGQITDIVWRQKARGLRHTITLNGRLHPFYTVPNFFLFNTRRNGALEVESRFFSIAGRKQFHHAELENSPLADFIWYRLRYDGTALRLHGGDMALARRLLTFDILDACANSFLGFLRELREHAAWRPEEGIPENYMPLIGDVELVGDFAKAARDLEDALTLTLDAIELLQRFDANQRQLFDALKLESKATRTVMQNSMHDLQEDLVGYRNRAMARVAEAQARSLKLLTLVASIFLPLTMACSLLSMSQRLNQLGPLLWDWAGIVVTLGSVVVLGYNISNRWQTFNGLPRVQLFKHLVKEEWANALYTVLKSEPAGSRRARQRRLIPRTPRFLFWITKYLTLVAVIVSFLLGMFIQNGSVSIGAQTLGYSIAGSVIFAFSSLFIYRCSILLLDHLRKSRKRKKESTQPSTQPNKLDEETGAGSRPPGRFGRFADGYPRLFKFFFKYIVGPLWLALDIVFTIMGWILRFYFGSFLLKVIAQVIAKILQVKLSDRRKGEALDVVLKLILGLDDKRHRRRVRWDPDARKSEESGSQHESNAAPDANRSGRSNQPEDFAADSRPLPKRAKTWRGPDHRGRERVRRKAPGSDRLHAQKSRGKEMEDAITTGLDHGLGHQDTAATW